VGWVVAGRTGGGNWVPGVPQCCRHGARRSAPRVCNPHGDTTEIVENPNKSGVNQSSRSGSATVVVPVSAGFSTASASIGAAGGAPIGTP
jgi:hypothetical protein